MHKFNYAYTVKLCVYILQIGWKCHNFQFKYSLGYAFVFLNGFHAKSPCYIKLGPRSNTENTKFSESKILSLII